jgi:hypothetical protein
MSSIAVTPSARSSASRGTIASNVPSGVNVPTCSS